MPSTVCPLLRQPCPSLPRCFFLSLPPFHFSSSAPSSSPSSSPSRFLRFLRLLHLLRLLRLRLLAFFAFFSTFSPFPPVTALLLLPQLIVLVRAWSGLAPILLDIRPYTIKRFFLKKKTARTKTTADTTDEFDSASLHIYIIHPHPSAPTGLHGVEWLQ